MIYNSTKTITRISIPANIAASVKYAEVIECITTESLKDWFSGNHPLDGCCAWEEITENHGNEDHSAFTSTDDAKEAIQYMIEDCLSIRRGVWGSGTDFQVYRETNTFDEEVHDWIVCYFLRDQDFNLKSIKTHIIFEDCLGGIGVDSFLYYLNQDGELTAKS